MPKNKCKKTEDMASAQLCNCRIFVPPTHEKESNFACHSYQLSFVNGKPENKLDVAFSLEAHTIYGH